MSDDLPAPTTVASATPSQRCGFPGCDRPRQPAVGPGRPPEYCDDPKHTTLASYRARKRQQPAAGTAADLPGDIDRPVSVGRLAAAELVTQTRELAGDLLARFQRLADTLATISDPDAAAIEVEAVTAEQAERVAAAQARATHAEHATRAAHVARQEAQTVADQAVAALEDSETARSQAERDAQTARDQADREITRLREQLQAAHAEATEAHQRAAAATDRATRAEEAALTTTQRLTDDLDRQRQRHDDAAAQLRADHAEQIRRLRESSEERLRDAEAAAAQLRHTHEQALEASQAAREEASRRADRAEAQNDQLIRDLAALRAQLTQVSQDLADANTRVARRGRVGGS